MNVLFVLSRHTSNPNDSTLTKDMAEEFANQGHNVYIITLLEKRYNQKTHLSLENGCNVLRVNTGNYFNTPRLEKAITTILMPSQLVAAAKKHLAHIQFDLILTHTPFVSSHKIIRPLRKLFACPTHLILWDIFPQNAWDIGLLRNKLLFKFLKKSEQKMLESYDHIWCMSDGNVNYMRSNYPFLEDTPVEKLYNSAKIKPLPNVNRNDLRKKYGFSADDVIAVFGGNMGTPQKLENILNLAAKAQENELQHAKFLFVGRGTETDRLMALANQMGLQNVKFIDQISRNDYELLAAISDMGIVSLDQRFTVPNFPSKTTDYFKLALPILASLDQHAMRDYGKFLVESAKAGTYAEAGKVDDLYNAFMQMYTDPKLRIELGANGRKFYEQELDVRMTYNKIATASSKKRNYTYTNDMLPDLRGAN